MKNIPKEYITGDRKPVLSLYELLNQRVNPYKQKTIEEYKAFLEGLTLSDMQDHAVNEAGTIPFDSREKLLKHLETQFLTISGQIEAINAHNEQALKKTTEGQELAHLSKAKQKQVRDFLSRGR